MACSSLPSGTEPSSRLGTCPSSASISRSNPGSRSPSACDARVERGDPRPQFGRGGLLVGGLGDLAAQRVLLGLERLDRGQPGTPLAVERQDAVDELGPAAAAAGGDADAIGLAAQQFDTQHDLPPLREPRTASYPGLKTAAPRPGLGRALTPTTLLTARTACPLCDSDSLQTGAKNGVPLRRCARCGHRFAGILPEGGALEAIYGDDYFTREYGDYHAEAAPLAARGAAYRRIVERWRGTGRVLDIGAAAGYVLEGFTAGSGWRGAGVELNPAMAAAARARGVDVRAGTVESALPEGEFDAVLLVQVIAHFPHVVQTLARLRERTVPGGIWVVESWDRRSVVARLLGRRWHEINPPSVLHWFSRRSLDGLLASLGFARVATGRPRKTIGAAHVHALLGAHRLLGPLARLIPPRAELPYPGDDVFWSAYRLRDDGPATVGVEAPGHARTPAG